MVDDGDGLGPTAGAAQTIDAGDRECYAYSPSEEEMACHPAGADPAEPSLSQAARIESCSAVGDDVVEA